MLYINKDNFTDKKRKLQLVTTIVLSFLFITQSYGQYFGQNKPKYRPQNFSILETPHFELHYYLRDRNKVNQYAQWIEQWYDMHQHVLQDEFKTKNPFILYNDHGDFQQTTAISGSIGVGTGGVTEAFKNRVILPVAMTNQQTFHVIGHELVHAFQYNMILGGDSTNLQSLSNLPLFMVEGLAEYMSRGSKDVQTAMWMRDAVLQNDVPSIKQMNNPQYFPYRWGQAFWSYLTGRYGDEVIRPLFRTTAMIGLQSAVPAVLGTSVDSLSADWQRNIKAFYNPLLKNKQEDPIGRVTFNEKNGGRMNLSPMVSPNGRDIIFFSEKRALSTDLYLADAQSGKIKQRIPTNSFTGSIDGVDFIESAGTWSPDGQQFAYVIFAKGKSNIIIKNVKNGKTVASYGFKNLSKFSYPAWSPDGRYIVVSGLEEGQTDLYRINLRTKRASRLTNDPYSEIQPYYSPDGSKIYFTTDEISFNQPRTDNEWHFNLAYFDTETEEIHHFDEIFPGADNMNPVVDENGMMYFLSDRDGYRNIYMYNTINSELYQVSDILTGVSGITLFSSAISITKNGKKLFYSHYTDNSYSIYNYYPDIEEMVKVDPSEVDQTAAMLPTFSRRPNQLVAQNLTTLDDQILVDASLFDKKKYQPKFKLDYIGGGGGLGVSSGNFLGTTTGAVGGVDMVFSDMLGNNQIYSTVALNGEIYDIGGQVLYRNQSSRIGWGGSLSHIPYRYGGYAYSIDTLPIENGGDYGFLNKYETYINRVFRDQASLFTQYAFNRSIRVETGGGYSLYYYRSERHDNYYDDFGRLVFQDRQKLESPDGFGLFNIDAAFVGDNSTFGFASPLDGYRFRIGVTQNFGHWTYTTTLVDLRKYFYLKKSNLSFRILQYGQYGADANNPNLTNYLIYPTFIRGFSKLDDQTLNAMGLSDRHIRGSKLLVGNAEFRVPFTGPESIALIPTGFLLSELAFFYDVGTTWSQDNPFKAVEGYEPKLLHSVGISLRINVFGSMILEPFYAVPLNKGGNGSFGMNFTPGW
ncbi:basic secretory protein-like protein [Membranihabitans marinus]|uniref:basic secretory protein-like protein n=1 Tax=Membranihabitans marinus TaxID=1227546 RepID=UPI001F3AB13E|nr:basic secretory protein-like protein [Membranihabitans marinus]